MRRFILFAFIVVLLMKNATPSQKERYPSRLAWLFGLKNKPNENKEENNSKEENNQSKEENSQSSSSEKSTACQSPECKKIARVITNSMDKSVDPCDDFYEYACGKWPENNPRPKGMKRWSMFASAQINVIKQITEIFDEGPKKDDLLAVKLAKKWYAVCMNTDAMDAEGLEPLVYTISRMGGWPMIMEPDEWNEEEYSWQKVDDQYVRLMGRNAFHDVRVVEYGSNESRKLVHIDVPHLPPGSIALWAFVDDSEEEEDESDEDLSDEEKQSDEPKDSQEPGSEGKDDNESDNKSKNDDEDDNDDSDENDDDNNDDENDDDNDDTNEQDDDEAAKKKVGVKKTGKFAKNKKLVHSRKIKDSAYSKKHKNHKMKRERVKRRAIATNIREKVRTWKNKKNDVKQVTEKRKKKLKETLEATTPRISTEETTEIDVDLAKEYTDYISKVARAIAKARGVEVSEEHMNKDIQDMIKFQSKLVDLTGERGKEEKLTLNDFQEWYDEKNPETSNSKIDWLYKIGELFDEAHVPVDSDLDMKNRAPDYFEGLISLLDKTSSRTIVNYIHWNFLSRIIRTTTSEMRKLYDRWENGGDDDDGDDDDDESTFEIPKRSRECTREVQMGDIIAYEYVRNHFNDEITTTASDMMDDIQKEVEYQIKESNWMDEDTKDFVLSKLVSMEKFIGYPDWYRNDTIVKRYFQGLIIGNSYYENTLSYERYSKWKRLRRLMKKDEDEDEDDLMTMSPIMVNAFFSPDLNSLALSAADFQSPLFAYGRPQVINYGIVGTIMGHEVNHGFDNYGKRLLEIFKKPTISIIFSHLIDKNGEFVEWLSAMAEAYGKRAECFVRQFNNYQIDKKSDFKIKNYGNRTAGENIADTMGLEASFRAYKRRERECGKQDTALPGHEDLTNDQLFFLSFANLLCEAELTESEKTKVKYDPHSTGRLRVIGTVSNSPDFAKAYNCSVGSAMNPEKKCNIWK